MFYDNLTIKAQREQKVDKGFQGRYGYPSGRLPSELN